MSLRVGVVGVGRIGQDHAERLTSTVAGATVVAVTDVDAGRARDVADLLAARGNDVPRVHATGEDLVADPDVDAVVVASWGPTHEQYVLAGLAAGMPVFCEKPLATTREACERILAAETQAMATGAGHRLVQVGYMRRYDPAFRALHDAVTTGSVGAPLLIHCAHRNASVPDWYSDDMMIADSAVHEIDVARWLLGEEIVAVRVLEPRRSSRAPERLRDPLLLLLESASGVLVDIELSMSVGYGYDVRCEVVGESGTAALADDGAVRVVAGGVRGNPLPPDWIDRFARAYDLEMQDWVDAVTAGRSTGPTAWDGYAAAVVAETCLRAPRTGERAPVNLGTPPAAYAVA